MQAITLHSFGDPSGLRVVDVPAPTPGPDQLLIRTEAIGVGGVDAMIRRGALGSAFPTGLIPGSEVAGVVTSVGARVDSCWIGRRVWAFTGTSGGYAEQAVALIDDVIALPEQLSTTDAVTLGGAGTVAHFALAHAHFASGETVLVRGAAGSIGIATVELAARGGAGAVAVTTSSAERGQRLRGLGATHVVERSGAGEGTPQAYDVIVDIVGGADVPLFLERLAPNGRLVLVGAVAGMPPSDFGSILLRNFQQSRSFATFSLASIPVAVRNKVRRTQLQTAAADRLTPTVHTILPLAQAAEAHRQMDGGRVFGRIVLVPQDL